MRILLTSTAMLVGLAGAAAAQATDPDPAPSAQPSVLERILGDVDDLQLNLANISENYADIDSSVTIDLAFDDVLATLLGGGETGNGLGLSLDGGDVATGLLDEFSFTIGSTGTLTGAAAFYDPTDMVAALAETAQTVSNVSNTAIGALSTGTIGGTTATSNGPDISTSATTPINVTLTSLLEQSEAIADTANATSSLYGSTGLVNFANLSGNYGATVDSAVTINVAGLVNVDEVSSTAIGALNTGTIASNITANLVGGVAP